MDIKPKRVTLCWWVEGGEAHCQAAAITHRGVAVTTTSCRSFGCGPSELNAMKRRALEAFRRQGVGVTLYCRPDVKAQLAIRRLGGVWGEVSKRTGGVVRMRDVVLPAGTRLPGWAREVME